MALYSCKDIFIGTVLLWGISLTQGSEYKYMYDNNETCIDVKMDVMFTLSDGEEVVKFDGNNFTVRGGDCATVGEYQAVLTLSNSNDDFLALTFNALSDFSVNMSLMFTFAPFEFFPGTPVATTTNLLDTEDLKLGKDTQLYQCGSTQRVTLMGELEGTTYIMYMDMSNVHIQAFNIKNGILSSNVFECKDDICALEEFEVPVTTVWSRNVTVDVSTADPTNMTTTIPVSPPTYTYKVVENSIVCLIMEGSFQLIVTYIKWDNGIAKKIINVPESSKVRVGGTCACGNDTTSSLTITAENAEIKSLSFHFEIIEGKSYLVFMSADVSVKMFPDVKFRTYSKCEINHVVIGKPLKLSTPKFYYKCDVGGNFSDDTMAFRFRNLRVQAFNVKNGILSENGYECKEDIGPIPNPGNPPVNMFALSDENVTCIVLKGDIQFNIPYMSDNGNAAEVITLPYRFNVTGDCNTKLNGYYSQKIVIGFYNSWKLTIYFSSDVQQSEILIREKVTKYHISQIELDYDFNNYLFTDAVNNIVGTNKTAVTANLNALTTNKDQSYTCKKESTFNIQNGVSMITKELQFQAFKTENSTAFSAAVNCKDSGDNYILLISTGAALGGLLLLVVVLVIVHKKHQNYERLTH